MVEKEIEEFSLIAKEILKQEITMEEIKELAYKWVSNKMEIRRKYGVEAGYEDLEKEINEHVEKIISLRKRLGLKVLD